MIQLNALQFNGASLERSLMPKQLIISVEFECKINFKANVLLLVGFLHLATAVGQTRLSKLHSCLAAAAALVCLQHSAVWHSFNGLDYFVFLLERVVIVDVVFVFDFALVIFQFVIVIDCIGICR